MKRHSPQALTVSSYWLAAFVLALIGFRASAEDLDRLLGKVDSAVITQDDPVRLPDIEVHPADDALTRSDTHLRSITKNLPGSDVKDTYLPGAAETFGTYLHAHSDINRSSIVQKQLTEKLSKPDWQRARPGDNFNPSDYLRER